MRNIIIGAMLSLIVFGVSATQPPVVVPPPEPYLECSLEQVVELEAEFDIPKFKQYQIPKGERFRKCFKLVGHSDEVGLWVVRTSVTDNDKITIEEGPYKGEPSLVMQEVSREIFNLSHSFNAVRQDQILYPIFSSEISTTHDREIIFGYELSSNGTFLLTVAITTDDPIRYVPNKNEAPSSSIPESSTSVSIPELLNIEAESSGVNSALFYGTKGSNVGYCPANSLPPANINQVKPVNAVLLSLEGQTGNYYSDNSGIKKIVDLFFREGGNKNMHINRL